MINANKTAKKIKYFIIIFVGIIILHFVFLRYDYDKLYNKQEPIFSIEKEYYPSDSNRNPAITYPPEYMYYGLGYRLIPKYNHEDKSIVIETSGIVGLEFIDMYIINADKIK